MDSFISWIGGKRALRKKILAQFPSSYNRYIEVFGGAGWMLFAEERKVDLEVYNDIDGRLVNLFKCVKHHPDALQKELEWIHMSRDMFSDARQDIHGLTDIQRAARFYILIKESFGTALHSFGARKKDMEKAVRYLRDVSHRLNKVVIEHMDFEHLIKVHDRPDALFYLDPPYSNAEEYYAAGFGAEDHARLHDALGRIKGKFILSYNDCSEMRELYKGYDVIEADRHDNLAAGVSRKRYRELIIKNYYTNIRSISKMILGYHLRYHMRLGSVCCLAFCTWVMQGTSLHLYLYAGKKSPIFDQVHIKKNSSYRYRFFGVQGGVDMGETVDITGFSAKITDISKITVSAAVLGDIFSVKDSRVRQMAREGIIERVAKGRYNLVDSLKNYILALKVAAEGPGIDALDSDINIDEEKALHERVKRHISELKLQTMKGELHKSQDVERVMADMLAAFRTRILAIPSKTAPVLEDRDVNYIKDRLLAECTEALSELKDYDPRAFYPDEYVGVDEDE